MFRARYPEPVPTDFPFLAHRPQSASLNAYNFWLSAVLFREHVVATPGSDFSHTSYCGCLFCSFSDLPKPSVKSVFHERCSADVFTNICSSSSCMCNWVSWQGPDGGLCSNTTSQKILFVSASTWLERTSEPQQFSHLPWVVLSSGSFVCASRLH